MKDSQKLRARAEITKAYASLDKLGREAYGKSFDTILRMNDVRQRNQRVRQLVGVLMKQSFSDRRPARSSDTMRYRWLVDTASLSKKSSADWEMRLLAASPDRRKNENGRALAARLRQESHLGRAFVRTLHAYICNDPKLRGQVKAALKAAGLEEFGGAATSQGVIKIASASIFSLLLGVIPGVAAAGIAVATVVVCTLGLATLCRTFKLKPSETRTRHQRHLRVDLG